MIVAPNQLEQCADRSAKINIRKFKFLSPIYLRYLSENFPVSWCHSWYYWRLFNYHHIGIPLRLHRKICACASWYNNTNPPPPVLLNTDARNFFWLVLFYSKGGKVNRFLFIVPSIATPSPRFQPLYIYQLQPSRANIRSSSMDKDHLTAQNPEIITLITTFLLLSWSFANGHKETVSTVLHSTTYYCW